MSVMMTAVSWQMSYARIRTVCCCSMRLRKRTRRFMTSFSRWWTMRDWLITRVVKQTSAMSSSLWHQMPVLSTHHKQASDSLAVWLVVMQCSSKSRRRSSQSSSIVWVEQSSSMTWIRRWLRSSWRRNWVNCRANSRRSMWRWRWLMLHLKASSVKVSYQNTVPVRWIVSFLSVWSRCWCERYCSVN